MKQCSCCKATKNLIKYAKSYRKNGSIRQLYYCRSCNTEKLKRYRATKEGMEHVRQAIIKYEKAHPERRNAWNKAQKIKMRPCEKCEIFPSQRHHPDPLKPLEVIFLCPPHHKKAERNMVK